MSVETPFDTKDFAALTAGLLESLRSGADGRPKLTDDTEGSVVRTLAEAFARELAVCYRQLQKVYQHGFLDTAEGVALDNVVALLGVSRQKPGHIEGSATFLRPQPAPEDIPVPAGTRIAGRGVPLFETTQDAFLPKGQHEVTVPVRSLEPGGETVKANSLSLMPRPIWGVEGVVNRADLLPRQREESDAELRERTRNVLRQANLGTTSAIEQAVRSLGIEHVTVLEEGQTLGRVNVALGDRDISDDLLNQAQATVQEVRPAGIQVNVQRSTPVYVKIAATLILRDDLPEMQKNTLRNQLTQALQQYFDSLRIGERVRWSKINAILNSPDEVSELLPPPSGTNYLSPYLGSPGNLSVGGKPRILRNGDIDINANERSALDLNVLPAEIRLEPLDLDVWVDIMLDGAALNPTEEQDLRTRLQTALDTIKPVRKITCKELKGIDVLQNKTILSFMLIHLKDNSVVELSKPNDADTLNDRERLLVGKIAYPRKQNA